MRVFARPLTGASLAAFCLLSCPIQSAAFISPSEEGYSFDIAGSIRTIAAVSDNYENPFLFGADNSVDGTSDTILRITAEGDIGTHGAFELHLVQDIYYSTMSSRGVGTAPVSAGSAESRYRIAELGRTWAAEDDFRAALYFDRLNGRFSTGLLDITVGRQAISFSQAYFWNPLDIFHPFDPESFDRSYKPGVDAFRTDLAVGPFSSLTFVAAAGRKLELLPVDGGFAVSAVDFETEPWYGSVMLVRGRTTVGLYDLTMQGGKVYGGYQLGGGFSGEIGPLGVRGEGTYLFAAGDSATLFPDPSSAGASRTVQLVDNHAAFVLGADHRFDSSLYLNGEYYFNGAGEGDDPALALARVAVGETTNIGEHYLGLQASYELHPLITGQIALIHSLTDASRLLTPTFTWSVANEAECIFGATLNYGDRPENLELKSEFGTYPDLYFLELVFYF